MGALAWLVQRLLWRRESQTTAARGWAHPVSEPSIGIGLSTPTPRIPVPEPGDWVKYPLDLDIGEVALGYHLIARGVSLSDQDLLFEYAFAPELSEEAHKEVWLNMFYDADVSPLHWNWVGAEGDGSTRGRRGRPATRGLISSRRTLSGMSISIADNLIATTY